MEVPSTNPSMGIIWWCDSISSYLPHFKYLNEPTDGLACVAEGTLPLKKKKGKKKKVTFSFAKCGLEKCKFKQPKKKKKKKKKKIRAVRSLSTLMCLHIELIFSVKSRSMSENTGHGLLVEILCMFGCDSYSNYVYALFLSSLNIEMRKDSLTSVLGYLHLLLALRYFEILNRYKHMRLFIEKKNTFFNQNFFFSNSHYGPKR